jgi:hypothetical protein
MSHTRVVERLLKSLAVISLRKAKAFGTRASPRVETRPSQSSWHVIWRALSDLHPSSHALQTLKKCSFREPSACRRCCTPCLAKHLPRLCVIVSFTRWKCLLRAKASIKRCAARSGRCLSLGKRLANQTCSHLLRLKLRPNMHSDC